MNTVHKIETWGNTHHPLVLDPIRIALGIFLAFKGASFINNSYTLHAIIANQNAITLPETILMPAVYAIAFIHLIGGMMLALGIFSRIASLVQIPIVLGAVLLSNAVQLPGNSSVWLSIVTLVLLMVFCVVGSGKLSIEKIMENQHTIFN
ncbi:DoxX-like protein [Mucilaginibacter gracilis]|uniref:DoxX-like protein n=1 Tax=Mucilaginibacter gracilis TaxID=423350 RepID=A0A495J549_9SPHI|nr:DoxX family protein [Mucilaginibacter gracilis]RKR83742.1 DoxX-like protein [Mucilaginibacter gracilis]